MLLRGSVSIRDAVFLETPSHWLDRFIDINWVTETRSFAYEPNRGVLIPGGDLAAILAQHL